MTLYGNAGGVQFAQCGNDGDMHRVVEVVITDPVLEEVAEDVKRLGGTARPPRNLRKSALSSGVCAERCRSETKRIKPPRPSR